MFQVASPHLHHKQQLPGLLNTHCCEKPNRGLGNLQVGEQHNITAWVKHSVLPGRLATGSPFSPSLPSRREGNMPAHINDPQPWLLRMCPCVPALQARVVGSGMALIALSALLAIRPAQDLVQTR